MSDDTPHSSNGSANKSFLHKVLQVLKPDPKNKDQLVDILNDAQDRDLINPETKQMIKGVLDVSEMRVREIMIPRSQMVTIDINHSLDEFLPIILESGHSRFPVVNENIDHVDGVITIEDILEQIVGEIEDETDDEIEEEIKHLAGNVYLVKALTELSDFNDYFNCDFKETNADTIGGIVLRQFNHMPQKGELFRLGNFEFKVLVADNRRMQMLQVSVDKGHEINGKVSD